MRLSAEIGTRKIEFEVKYRQRKTMAIHIDKTGALCVLAPVGIPAHHIKQQVLSKSKWIAGKLMDLEQAAAALKDRRYATGEKFMFLGKMLPLYIVVEKTLKGVYLFEGVIYIRTSENDEKHIKKILEKWYREQALQIIKQRLHVFVEKMGLRPKLVKVKEQKKRWASATSCGNLYFNWRIVMAPLDVIDYVIVHELSHLAHGDHSKNFWDKVKEHMPDYAHKKKWLKDNGLVMEL